MKPYYQDDYVTIYHGDCLDILPKLNPVDLVLTDPPYEMISARWDVIPDPFLLTKMIKEKIKASGFYCFFGRMPTILKLIIPTQEKFNFREHITWIKRSGMPSFRLRRIHEEILIYSLDNIKFYNTSGPFEDIALPGLLFGQITVETIKRHISALWYQIETGEPETSKPGKCRSEVFRYLNTEKIYHRSPRETGYTNVWSFLPENLKRLNKKGKHHPTSKPKELIERLINMLSLESFVILDPFLGGGTTLLAAKNLGRRAIGIEIEEEYCEIAAKRMAQEVLKFPEALK